MHNIKLPATKYVEIGDSQETIGEFYFSSLNFKVSPPTLRLVS